MARRTTQSKKYGGKISKTYIAELYFSKNHDMTNEEIAKIISDDISPTSINQVAMMRSRFKNKMAELIANHPSISNSVKKIINSECCNNKKNALIMGYTTYINLPIKKIKNSFNLVITNKKLFDNNEEDLFFVDSFGMAIDKCKELEYENLFY